MSVVVTYAMTLAAVARGGAETMDPEYKTKLKALMSNSVPK